MKFELNESLGDMEQNLKKTKLQNGITVLTETVRSTRSAAIGVFVKVGSRNENKKIMGIAHFLEHMAFKGTTTRTAKDIVEEIESKGGAINAFTSKEITGYFAKVLDTNIKSGIKILIDIVKNSVYPKNEIEKEKTVVIEEFNEFLDSPSEVAFDGFCKQMYPDHPLSYNILGNKQTIKSFDQNKIKEFVNENYTPGNIIVVCTGNISHGEFLEHVKEQLNDHSIVNKSLQQIKLADPIKKKIVKKANISQTHYFLGRRAYSYKNKDHYTYKILNALLSAGMGSRLFQNIREKYGFVYSIYSFADMYRDTGIFGIYVGTDKKKIDDINELVWNELNEIKNNSMSRSELNKIKKQYEGALVFDLESMLSRMNKMVQTEIQFGKFVEINEILSSLEKVTLSNIQTMANELFQESKFHYYLLTPNKD